MAHLLNIFNYQTLLIIVLVISSHFMVTIFGAIAIRHCQKTEDCDENQCCTSIPASGKKICINYEQAGEMCFFRFRTPVIIHKKTLKTIFNYQFFFCQLSLLDLWLCERIKMCFHQSNAARRLES